MRCDTNTVAIKAMEYAMERAEWQGLLTIQTLVMEKLSMLVSSSSSTTSPTESNINASINLALNLLQHTFIVLDKKGDMEKPNLVKVKEIIMNHPVLDELSSRFSSQVKHLASGEYANIDAEVCVKKKRRRGFRMVYVAQHIAKIISEN